ALRALKQGENHHTWTQSKTMRTFSIRSTPPDLRQLFTSKIPENVRGKTAISQVRLFFSWLSDGLRRNAPEGKSAGQPALCSDRPDSNRRS
ncbi:hypothetical protein, partial [Undibacterium sp. RuTC16W]|uniref:hypothetical protein n=1 Tax=Undibacterium sp. RuTC16W TaxID=3413048 RepID=UPI003BF3EEF6